MTEAVDVAVTVEDVVDHLEEQTDVVAEREPRLSPGCRYGCHFEAQTHRRDEQPAGLEPVERLEIAVEGNVVDHFAGFRRGLLVRETAVELVLGETAVLTAIRIRGLWLYRWLGVLLVFLVHGAVFVAAVGIPGAPVLPYGVYTIPEIAMVGRTEEDLTRLRVAHRLQHLHRAPRGVPTHERRHIVIDVAGELQAFGGGGIWHLHAGRAVPPSPGRST